MPRPSLAALAACLLATAALAGGGNGREDFTRAPRSTRYQDLVSLFVEWRSFQRPKLVDGVPDYSARAMAAQQRELASYQRRLTAIDPRGWPIGEQADYHVVRAEMNGLDFDHRVLKPWANNPAFYVTAFTSESDQPAREGPLAYGALEFWTYTFPLTAQGAAEMGAGLRAIPKLLRQAKTNLVGDARDLWTFGTKSIRQQSADLAQLASRLDDASGDLKADLQRAKQATDALEGWLVERAASKTGPSGVGVENYDWYLKNVQLAPYTWREEATIMERELARAHALLAMEEQRNAKLPPQVPIASAAEYSRRFDGAITEYMAFLRDHEILTIRDYHGARAAGADRRVQPSPPRVFRRSRLPRPGAPAHPRLSLVRQGADGARAACEPDPAASAPLQHLQYAD